MRRNLSTLAIVLTLSAGSFAQSGARPATSPGFETLHVQEIETDTALQVACSADKPTVVSGETLRVRAWCALPAGQTARYGWTATAGMIDGQASDAQWDFSGVQPGLYKATVTVRASVTRPTECSVEVIVVEGARGVPTRETGRAFLEKGKKEASGYGLYSYLLLGAHPTDSTRDRYLKAIQAYLDVIDDITRLEDYISRPKLNITYLPIETVADTRPTPDWVVERYDYARARALLDLLPGTHREGPYLVSVLKPLDSAGNPTDHYLFQDLSTVPTEPKDLVSWWVREFLNQAAQVRFWQPRTAELLVLKLRTTIGVLAAGLPDVQNGMDSCLAWIH
jgi:hypothetical protein